MTSKQDRLLRTVGQMTYIRYFSLWKNGDKKMIESIMRREFPNYENSSYSAKIHGGIHLFASCSSWQEHVEILSKIKNSRAEYETRAMAEKLILDFKSQHGIK